MRLRPVWILVCSLVLVLSSSSSSQTARRRSAGLTDFGGDVGQYMSLLSETSAFSFKPGGAADGGILSGIGKDDGDDDDDDDDAASEEADRRRRAEPLMAPEVGAGGDSPMGDFGGDYGDYLKLLEGDTALGFNPQSDPIGDNQDLQTDVFGGGMSGKFWDLYKGKTSYDSFDESDDTAFLEQLDMLDDEDATVRQASEEDQPDTEEDQPEDRGEGNQARDSLERENILVAFKPNKSKMAKLYSSVKKALLANDKKALGDIVDSLDIKKLLSSSSKASSKNLRSGDYLTSTDNNYMTRRKVMFVQDDDDDEEEEEATEVEKEDQSRALSMKKLLEDFVDTFATNVPDPIATSKGLSMNYRNLTLFGHSDLRLCGPDPRRQFGSLSSRSGGRWIGTLCMPSLSATVNCVTGPGVPFKGRVSVIFKQPKIQLTFHETTASHLHVDSLKILHVERAKFVPTYDSSIPLNPWSKVSMSGYMVARVKKVLPKLLDKTLLRLTHVVEKLDDE